MKPKYVEKEKSQQTVETQKSVVSERMRSPKNYHSIKSVRSPKKYVEKEKMEVPNQVSAIKSTISEDKLNFEEK